MNAFLRFVDAQQIRVSADGTNGMTGCGYSNAQGDVIMP